MDFSNVRSCLLLITLVAVKGDADLSSFSMNRNGLANKSIIEDMVVNPFGSVSLIEQQEEADFKPGSSKLNPKAMCALLKLGTEQTDNNDNSESYKCLIEQSCTPNGKQQDNQLQAGLCKYISTLDGNEAAWMTAYREENCKETSSMAEEIDMEINYSSENASQDAEKESVECYPLTPVMKCELYELGMKGNFKKTTQNNFTSKFNRFCSTQGKALYCNQTTKTLDLDRNLKDHLFKGPQQHLFSIYADFCLPEEKQVAEEAIASFAFEHGYTKVDLPGNPHHLVDASQQVSNAIAQESTAVAQQNQEFSKQSSKVAAESPAHDQQVAQEEKTMVQAAKAAALNKVHVSQAAQSPERKTRQAQDINIVANKQKQKVKHTNQAAKQQQPGKRHTKHKHTSSSKASPTGHHSKIPNIAIQQKKFDMRQQVYRQKKEQLTKEVGADKAELKKLDSGWAAYERKMESKGVCTHSCTAWEDTKNSKGQGDTALNNKEDKPSSKGQHNKVRNMKAMKDNVQVNPTTMPEQSAFYQDSGSMNTDSSSAETSSIAEPLNGLLEFLTDFE